MSKDHATIVETIQAQDLVKVIQEQQALTNKSFLIIDVRDVDHKGEHIVGSRNIPYFNKEKATNLIHEIQLANQSQEIFDTIIFHCFYCTIRGPAAAQLFADTLKTTLDYSGPAIKVKYLEGGWARWKQLYSKKPANLIVKNK